MIIWDAEPLGWRRNVPGRGRADAERVDEEELCD